MVQPDIRKRKLRNTIAIAIVILIVIVAACAVLFRMMAPAANVSPDDPYGTNSTSGSVFFNALSSGTLGASSFGALPEKTLEEMVESSQIIVVGEMIGRSGVLTVESALDVPDPAYFIDSYLKVEQVAFGDAVEASEVVAVRTRCDGNGSFLNTAGEAERGMDIGSKYLLFLYQRADGVDYNTEGDHYLIVVSDIGMCMEIENGVFESRSHETIISTSNVEEAARRAGATPLTAEAFTEKQLAWINEEYKAENISESSYETLIKEFDNYATLVQ